MTEVEELCNRIWFISQGKILHDMNIKDIKSKHKNLVGFVENLFHDLREVKNKEEKAKK